MASIIDRLPISPGAFAVVRELSATAAAVAIVIPPVLGYTGALPVELAAILCAVGVALIFAHRPLQRAEENRKKLNREREHDAFRKSAYVRQYVITKHRLAMLEENDVSPDVVDELRPLRERFGTATPAHDFLPEIERTLGAARFEDDFRMIVEAFDVERPPHDRRTTAGERPPMSPDPQLAAD